MSDVAVTLRESETAINDAVQTALSKLDAVVTRQVRDAKVDSGTTRGRDLYLFSYRRYSRSNGSAIDPIVVGVNCQRRDGGILISGDASGEEGGDVIFTAADSFVSDVSSADDVKSAVERVALELSGKAADIARALIDQGREI